ncbi:MAG: hypothetical protein ACRDVL_01260 [Acidimicrobiia bacterium]
MTRSFHLLMVVGLLAVACAGAVATDRPLRSEMTAEDGTVTEGMATAGTVGSLDSCPLTIPPHPGFVPPEPYPPEPPGLYQAVWYGTPQLWTMLAPQDEVWEGLPFHNGAFGQKTFWWSEGYSWLDEPTPAISVTGRQLDGSSSFEAGGPGTNGFREDIGSFMLVGVGIPNAGCWELTAQYRDTELPYVVWVEG